ncbi:MAG: hypothetical protein IBX63_09100 [Coriobacteriia bacterium]|nr:hypothetical protein [Coriobacteriia bacterium]
MTAVIVPEVLVVLASILAGWMALWPSRANLGPTAYHLAAFPVGLLAWVFVAGASILSGWPYLPGEAIVGGGAFVSGLRALQRRSRQDSATERSGGVTAASFAAAGAAYAGVTAALAATRLTVFTPDSVSDYWPMALLLEREAEFSAFMISSRGFLQVSVGAAKAAVGGEWLFVLYPLLGAALLVTLAWTIWTTAPATLGRTGRMLLTGLPTVFLLTDPSFLFYSLYVHSHAPSALYLLLSLVGLRLAADPATGQAAGGARGWLAVSGLATAGLALTRPDGLAYAFLPIAGALSLLLDRRRGAHDSAAYFGPLLFVVIGAHVAAYAQLGVWEAQKLDGRLTAAILLVMAASAALPWLARTTGLGERLRLESGRVLLAEIAAAAALVALVAVMSWENVSLSVMNLTVNLFDMGGYGPLWYLLAAAVLATVLTGHALRPATWGRSLFLSIVLFFLMAVLVHGTSHVGRVGWGDSANRVAFHIVPVIVWYVAEVAGSMLTRNQSGRRTS